MGQPCLGKRVLNNNYAAALTITCGYKCTPEIRWMIGLKYKNEHRPNSKEPRRILKDFCKFFNSVNILLLLKPFQPRNVAGKQRADNIDKLYY